MLEIILIVCLTVLALAVIGSLTYRSVVHRKYEHDEIMKHGLKPIIYE